VERWWEKVMTAPAGDAGRDMKKADEAGADNGSGPHAQSAGA